MKAAALSRTDNLIEYFRNLLPLESRHSLFTSSGRAAFEQIVLDAGLQHSRIILPAFMPQDFVGIFRKYDMTPVFVDVDPHSYQLDLNGVTADLLDRCKAMLVLHTFGLPTDARPHRELCERHGLVLIEDCARALGASTHGVRVGGFGHYALFSLPKCTPVRTGGIALSERPMQPQLEAARIGFFGFLHALTLVRYPLLSFLERPAYALLAGTAAYPGEVGIYEPLPARELDWLAEAVLKGFMGQYPAALEVKRQRAAALCEALTPKGFSFQYDDGNHIRTSVSVEPPAGCDADDLQAFLKRRGIKATAMWRNALGVSAFAERTWGTQPSAAPVAGRLAKRLIQLPTSRVQTPRQTRAIVAACESYLAQTSSRRSVLD